MGGAAGNRVKDLGPEDFDAIRDAVMETPRGRWFLAEFESRLRQRDAAAVLDAVRRLEAAISHNHDAVMQRLAEALSSGPSAGPAPAPPQPELAPRHMKYFRHDEDIFEPAPQARITAPPEAARPAPEARPAVARGARLIIRRTADAEAPQPPGEAEPGGGGVTAGSPVSATAPATDAGPAQPVETGEPRRRIVIIRHQPGEDIEIPLRDDLAAAS